MPPTDVDTIARGLLQGARYFVGEITQVTGGIIGLHSKIPGTAAKSAYSVSANPHIPAPCHRCRARVYAGHRVNLDPL